MSREINSASAEQDHHATSGVVDKEVQKAIDIQIELAKQLLRLTTLPLMIKDYEIEVEKRNRDLLISKGALKDNNAAQEARIFELERELEASKHANVVLGTELEGEREEVSRLKSLFEEQNDEWKKKFDASRTKVDNLTATLTATQSAPTPARRFLKEHPVLEQINHCSLPERRQQALDSYPHTPSLPDDAYQNPAYFSRLELMTTLGGGSQSLVANISKSKERTAISVLHDVTGILYPYRDLNPWLPSALGEHGYMFVGLCGPGGDNEKFSEPEVRALFIPVGSSWRYYGHYEVFRDPDNDLSVHEWSAFSEDFKLRYAELTLSKRKAGSKFAKLKKSSPAKVEEEIKEVVQDYNSGVLRVPLVQLICVNYDHGLVTSLRNAPKITLGKRSHPKGKSTVGRPQGTKRARTQRMDPSEPLIEIHEESSQPEKRKSGRKVKLVARPDYEGPRSGDEPGESSASDPDEYEDSENE